MTTTARARIEQAVVKTGVYNDVTGPLTITLILAERARLKRGVRKLRRYQVGARSGMIHTDAYEETWVYLRDMLALWEK